MLIQYVSDLHIEFLGTNYKNKIKPVGDVLCLAGDICACGIPKDFINFVGFLKYICPKFKYVLHVAGNHEYYTDNSKATTGTDIKKNTFQGINQSLKDLQKTIPNYFYLNCSTVKLNLDNKIYTFIGATLWAHVSPKNYDDIQNGMNDYNFIHIYKNKSVVKFTVADMQKIYKRHLQFIATACKENKNCILITHHKPVADTLEKDKDILTQAYETDITKYITSNVKLAIHGHTHRHYHKKINGTLFVSNPRGYPSQRTNFVKDLVIDFDKL